GQMEGFDHLHVEAAEEAAQHEQQDDGRHHHFGDVVPAALFNTFTNQNTQYQPRYGVTHDQLCSTAKDGGPEAGFFTCVDGRQPEDHWHHGVHQQVSRRHQYLHGGHLECGRNGRAGQVKEGHNIYAVDGAGYCHFEWVMPRLTGFSFFNQQRRCPPVRDDAVVNVLCEGTCGHGRSPGVKEET